jgi:DNA-binding CsgD family transcriptional regulator
MAELRRADAERLLAFVGDAHTLDGPEPFTTELLDRLAETMHSEFATYYEFDLRTPGVPLLAVRCSRARHYQIPQWPYRPSDVPDWAVRPPGVVFAWSDEFERAARWRFDLWPWAKPLEMVDCTWSSFPAGGSQLGVVGLHRQGRDFGERDRKAFSALVLHVTPLIRNACARRRLADLTAVTEAADESSLGYVLLSGGLEVEHASSAAHQILGSWFDEPVGRLPALVEDWLRSDARHEPLRIERGRSRLVVDAPTARALVLSEERVLPATLTAREREVLRWIAAGKSTSEIAGELWVTSATVSKHLHHIYRKLGVTSRTAALAALGARED